MNRRKKSIVATSPFSLSETIEYEAQTEAKNWTIEQIAEELRHIKNCIGSEGKTIFLMSRGIALRKIMDKKIESS